MLGIQREIIMSVLPLIPHEKRQVYSMSEVVLLTGAVFSMKYGNVISMEADSELSCFLRSASSDGKMSVLISSW